MNPGKKLDELVGIKIMGWKRMSWREYHDMKRVQGRFRGEDNREELTDYWHDQNGEMNDHFAEETSDYCDDKRSRWSPSTNINDAFEILNKLCGGYREYSLSKKINCGICDGDIFVVDLFLLEVGNTTLTKFHAYSEESLAHAICLAALKAVKAI